MTTWSRDQSQRAGSLRNPSSGLKVTSLGNLQPISDKQKAHLRRSNGIKKLWSQDRDQSSKTPQQASKERDFLAPKKADYKPPRIRGASGTRLSGAKRDAVVQRNAARELFFASL